MKYQDMTKGKPLKLILAFTIPLLFGNLFQQLYGMVDTLIVGRTINPQALAAVGLAGTVTFLVLGFVQGVTAGFSVVVSQRFGAEDEQGLRHAVAASAVLGGFTIVIVTALAMLGTKPLLILMQTPDDMMDYAYTYLIIVFAGIIGIVFYNLISGIVRALGDSRTPLIFLIVACAINIVLDLVFILICNMGVAGAALATVIAQLGAGGLCLLFALKKYAILRLRKEDWKVPKEIYIQELKIGVPMGFQFSVTAIGVIIIQTVLNTLGSNTVAAYTAAVRVFDLLVMPMISLGMTMATFSAQNFGAGRTDRVRVGVKMASLIIVVYSVISALLLIFFGSPLIGIFFSGSQPEMIAQGQIFLYIAAPPLFILGLLFVYRNTLQGMGIGLIPMLAGVSELIVRFLVAVTFAVSVGFAGVCLAEPLAWVGADLLLVPRYIKFCRDDDKKRIENGLPVLSVALKQNKHLE